MPTTAQGIHCNEGAVVVSRPLDCRSAAAMAADSDFGGGVGSVSFKETTLELTVESMCALWVRTATRVMTGAAGAAAVRLALQL